MGDGGEDEHLPSTARIHLWARRRGGMAAAARTQQRERVRRIGVLMGLDENDPVAKTIVSAFKQTLAHPEVEMS
jgi:hypothetical protein